MALIRQGVSGNETVSDIETVAGVERTGAGAESLVVVVVVVRFVVVVVGDCMGSAALEA